MPDRVSADRPRSRGRVYLETRVQERGAPGRSFPRGGPMMPEVLRSIVSVLKNELDIDSGVPPWLPLRDRKPLAFPHLTKLSNPNADDSCCSLRSCSSVGFSVALAIFFLFLSNWSDHFRAHDSRPSPRHRFHLSLSPVPFPLNCQRCCLEDHCNLLPDGNLAQSTMWSSR